MSTKIVAPMLVVAIASADEKQIKIYGTGVYVGKETAPGTDKRAPKINLDNGFVVWGTQCYWGPATDFENVVKGREVIEVPVPDDNPRWTE